MKGVGKMRGTLGHQMSHHKLMFATAINLILGRESDICQQSRCVGVGKGDSLNESMEIVRKFEVCTFEAIVNKTLLTTYTFLMEQ